MIRLRARKSSSLTTDPAPDVYPGAEAVDDHEVHAAGEICARCDRTLTARDEVRRTAAGAWVHTCC